MEHILIIDDDNTNLAMMRYALAKDYRLTTADSAQKGMRVLDRDTPDMVLLNLEMQGIIGEEIVGLIRANDKWSMIPILFVAAKDGAYTGADCLKMGANDYIIQPLMPTVILHRVRQNMELEAMRSDLATRLVEEKKKTALVTLNSIMSIANTIDAKDRYTSGHSIRVAKCAVEIAKKLGWSEAELQNLHYVALLHDIGKIGVPDSILNKPTKLSEVEFDVIRGHPVIGGDILKDIHTLDHVEEAALFHHERYDGKGYPFGLKGIDIPIYARIVGIADAYDAMTSNRVYRKSLPQEEVIREFERCSGTQFDPNLVEVFIGMLREGFQVADVQVQQSHDIADESRELLNKVLTEYATEAQNRSMTDVLTGIYNRDYAQLRVGELLNTDHQGAMFMMDMDNFKQINDTYGHLVGDQTLQIFADVLREHSSDRDVICRLGGDEFIAFFTGMQDREEAAQKAESIIGTFLDRFRGLGYYSESTSISIGIAFTSRECADFQSLYRNSDKSLYYIKNNGKNSYHFYSDNRDKVNSYNTVADLNNVRRMIEGDMDTTQGAFHVDYDKFQKIYDFVSRCVERKDQMVQTVLLTLSSEDKDYPDADSLEKAMNALEMAVITSLRIADVGTRYSSSQYIVILLDADTENGRKVAERVCEKFRELYPAQNICLTFDTQTMQPKEHQDPVEIPAENP